MKRLFFILTIFLLLLIKYPYVNSDTSEWHVMRKGFGNEYYSFTTSELDNISILKRDNYYQYRICVNNDLYLDIEKLNNRIAFLKFYETYSYYFIYGSMYRNYEKDDSNTIPYIVRVDKNLNKLDYLIKDDKEVLNYNRFFDMIEFKKDKILVTELYNATYDGFYIGNYKLNYYDENLELINEIECGENECTISIAYDTIDIVNSQKKHFYFSMDFNILETYSRNKEYTGYIEFLTDCYIDDRLYKAGSILSVPGEYKITDKVHEERIIKIYPIIEITGDMKDGIYYDYIEYKVSGGQVYINDEISYINGLISKPGEYTIKVIGLNGLTKEETFMIAPMLLSTINDGDTLYVNDTIEFSGNAKLNGTIISSGYRLKEEGNYTLELFINDHITEKINFSVNEVSVPVNTKKKVIISLGIISIIILIVIIVIIILDIKKKRKYLKDDDTSYEIE